MDYLSPKDIERKLPPNTIDTDFRAELFAALLTEAGFDIGQIVMVREGNCGGHVSKLIATVAYRSLFDIAESPYIEITTRRPGIYDLLPEDLFHSPAYAGKVRDKANILKEIKQHREEEFFIRRLFRLFENEVDRGGIESQLLELRYDKKNKYRNYVDIFSAYWSVIGRMPIRNALLLVRIIPHIHLIRNSLEEIGKALSLILDAPVKVVPKKGKKHISAERSSRIGCMRLGTSSVNTGVFCDAETDLSVHVGDIPAGEVERFLPGNLSRRMLTGLADIFFGADKEFSVTVGVVPAERKAFLKSADNIYPCYLGINTYL